MVNPALVDSDVVCDDIWPSCVRPEREFKLLFDQTLGVNEENRWTLVLGVSNI